MMPFRRILLVALIIFLLYWGIKGLLRRLFGVGPARRVRAGAGRSAPRDGAPNGKGGQPEAVHSERSVRNGPAPIDYSKVRDASFRDKKE